MGVRVLLNMGFTELILILLIAFLVVGPDNLPKVGRALAKGLKYARNTFYEIKKSVDEDEDLEKLKEVKENIKNPLKDINPMHEVNLIKQDIEKTIKEATPISKNPDRPEHT